MRSTRELRQIEVIANSCVRPRDSGKRPDVVDGVEGRRRMPISPCYEKIYGWREKRCFAAWNAALYFGGSTRDISLVPHEQEHEK